MAWWVGVFASEPDNLSLSPGPMCWKERVNWGRLTPDLHSYAMVHTVFYSSPHK